MNPYDCSNATNPYRQPLCLEDGDEKNRIIHVAYVKKGTLIPRTSPAAAVAALLAAETSCDAIIIRNVNGTKGAPSANKGKGFGRQDERTLAKSHSITYSDKHYWMNVAFYNSMEVNAYLYDLYYMTDTLAWPAAGKVSLNLEASDDILDDVKTFQEGTITVSWTQKGNPVPFKMDTEQLDAPQEFFDPTSMLFTNAGGSTATISSDGGTITQTTGTAFEVQLNVALPIDSVTVVSGELPSGVVAGIGSNGQTVTISGSSTELGTHEVVLTVANACGLATQLAVKVVITAS